MTQRKEGRRGGRGVGGVGAGGLWGVQVGGWRVWEWGLGWVSGAEGRGGGSVGGVGWWLRVVDLGVVWGGVALWGLFLESVFEMGGKGDLL